jgi:hypothetical protein
LALESNFCCDTAQVAFKEYTAENGFDFLGYHISPEGLWLSMAEKTIEKFLARAVRLYEQEQGGALRLPLAWIISEAVDEMVNFCPFSAMKIIHKTRSC